MEVVDVDNVVIEEVKIKKKRGPKTKLITEEDKTQAKVKYNRKYYMKRYNNIAKLEDGEYSDEELLKIIKLVGFNRLLHLIVCP